MSDGIPVHATVLTRARFCILEYFDAATVIGFLDKKFSPSSHYTVLDISLLKS